MAKYSYTNKEIEIIIRFIESLNNGNCRDATSRVGIAIKQYEQLKEKVIYAEADNYENLG